jgi:hypothetical protein
MQRSFILVLGLGLSLNVLARDEGSGFSQQRPSVVPQQQPQTVPQQRPNALPQTQPQFIPQTQQPAAAHLSDGEMLRIAEEAVTHQARREHPRGGIAVSLEMGTVSYENPSRARIKGNGHIRTPEVNERIFYNVGIDLRTNRAFEAKYRNDDNPN